MGIMVLNLDAYIANQVSKNFQLYNLYTLLSNVVTYTTKTS